MLLKVEIDTYTKIKSQEVICICYHGNSNCVGSVGHMSYGCYTLIGIILELH
jgi:hypothetical protein